jgi:hypothetical protein
VEDIVLFFIANPRAIEAVRHVVERIAGVVSQSIAILSRDRLVVQSDGFRMILEGDFATFDSLAVERYVREGRPDGGLPSERMERIAFVLARTGPLVPRGQPSRRKRSNRRARI